MEFHFNCPNCAHPVVVGTYHVGLTISCPHCRVSVCVPDPNDQTEIFRPFTDDELVNCIQHFPAEVVEQILQIEPNDLCWPSQVFAAMIDSTLDSHLVDQSYEPSGASIFSSTSKTKRTIIAKQIEYFEIIEKILIAVEGSFRHAVYNHDIHSMRGFTDSLEGCLREVNEFCASLEKLTYPSKEPYEYLIQLMLGWKEELAYSLKTVAAALRSRAMLDPESARLNPVQVSLTPLSVYEFNEVLFK